MAIDQYVADLHIAHRIKHGTIDKITAMDDGELALAVLSGQLKPPI